MPISLAWVPVRAQIDLKYARPVLSKEDRAALLRGRLAGPALKQLLDERTRCGRRPCGAGTAVCLPLWCMPLLLQPLQCVRSSRLAWRAKGPRPGRPTHLPAPWPRNNRAACAGQELPVAELASKYGVDEVLLGRVLRYSSTPAVEQASDGRLVGRWPAGGSD